MLWGSRVLNIIWVGSGVIGKFVILLWTFKFSRSSKIYKCG
jgi:hypothetical protein